MKSLFKSWKSTLAGFVLFLGATGTEIIKLLDDDPTTNPEIKIIFAALMVFLGFSATGDDDKKEDKKEA